MSSTLIRILQPMDYLGVWRAIVEKGAQLGAAGRKIVNVTWESPGPFTVDMYVHHEPMTDEDQVETIKEVASWPDKSCETLANQER